MIGGLPQSGLDFGAAVNTEAVSPASASSSSRRSSASARSSAFHPAAVIATLCLRRSSGSRMRSTNPALSSSFSHTTTVFWVVWRTSHSIC